MNRSAWVNEEVLKLVKRRGKGRGRGRKKRQKSEWVEMGEGKRGKGKVKWEREGGGSVRSGRGLLEVYQGWTYAASAGDLEEVY